MPKVIFNEELCKGCELCRHACPKGVIGMCGEINRMGYRPARAEHPDLCTGCTFCAMMCPDLAITVEREARI